MYGSRTRVSSLRGWCPCRLDELDRKGGGMRGTHAIAGRLSVSPFVEQVGFEPTIFCLQGRRISRLMLQPHIVSENTNDDLGRHSRYSLLREQTSHAVKRVLSRERPSLAVAMGLEPTLLA